MHVHMYILIIQQLVENNDDFIFFQLSNERRVVLYKMAKYIEEHVLKMTSERIYKNIQNYIQLAIQRP